MSKNQVDTDALKPVLIKLLEDDEVINSIRGALCRVLGCAVGAPVAQGEPRGEQGGEHESAQGDKEKYRKIEERLQEAEHKLADTSRQITAQEADLEGVRKERERLQRDYTSLQQRSVLPPDLADVLAHVRSDAELVKRLELNTDLDDTAMLVQTVAVLSQESNLKRLWEFYKSRCEARRAELSPQDRAVFKAALSWLNANRPDRPHEMSYPATGINYDYEKNIRPPGMSGETITAVWLPGVPAMKLLPLVATS